MPNKYNVTEEKKRTFPVGCRLMLHYYTNNFAASIFFICVVTQHFNWMKQSVTEISLNLPEYQI